MKLPELALRKSPFTIIVLLLLTLLGGASYLTMPRSEDPQFDTPTVRVTAIYPGASPEDIESLVVDPVEEALNEIEDVDRIESTIEDGLATVSVDFLASIDPEDGYEDVQQAIAGIERDLPEDLQDLIISKFSTTNVSIFQAALVSETASYERLATNAEQLEQALERVGGVKSVETWAYPDQEVRVGIDLDRLRELGLSTDRVIQAIQADAQNVPGGNLDVGSRRFNVQTSGDFASVDAIRQTVVGSGPEGIIYLGDVAAVREQDAKVTYHARFNGERAVFVTVEQRKGVNIFNVLDEVEATVSSVATGVPSDVRVETVFDQAESVSSRVDGFFLNLLQGILLVGGVILIALGWRASGVVMLAIPLSILIAIFVLDTAGYGLQQISIVGLVIALGLLVDDAIVITENVARYRRKGLGAIEAALKGTDEVGWAVVSTSVTSILAFLPIVLVQSGSGDFIRSMPLTVIYALLASLLVSLTLTPLLAAKWMGKEGGNAGKREGGRGADGATSASSDAESGGFSDRSATSDPVESDSSNQDQSRIEGPLGRLLQRVVDGPYRTALRWALDHRLTVLGIAVAALVASASLFPIIGVSFFPDAEKPQFLVSVTTSQGASLDVTDRAVRRVEALLKGRDDVRRYAANVGRDNPLVYYNVIPRREQSTVGQVFVEARSAADVPTLEADLREALSGVPGVTYEFEIFKNGPPVEAPVAIKVIGPELDELDRLAAEVEALVQQTPGTQNVDNPLSEEKTDLHVRVDRDRAGMMGVPLATVDRTVRMAVAGLPVARYREADGDERDVVVGLDNDHDTRVSDVERLSVGSVTGAQVPIRQIASVELKAEATRIDHFETERAVTVTADVDTRGGYSAVAVTQSIASALEERTLPAGYRTFVGGELEAQQDSFASLLPALLGAIFGILAVLVLQFNSVRQSLIIFTAIPLSVIGAFPALLITGYTFSFTAFVGFTSLVGIVVNNSTILVDYANQLVEAGQTVRDAVREASETRLAPIVLTTLTTIGGLLPLTLSGSSLWSPLGWVIIGGLVVSTALTLLVVPALYLMLTPEKG